MFIHEGDLIFLFTFLTEFYVEVIILLLNLLYIL